MKVLDTHALLWWVSGDAQLSKKARNAIIRAQAESKVLVSAISAWEIAMLVKRGRLVLAMPVSQWLAEVAQIEALHFVPVDIEIGTQSVDLPGDFHADPADRMIVATARQYGAALITRDEKMRAYAHVKTVW